MKFATTIKTITSTIALIGTFTIWTSATFAVGDAWSDALQKAAFETARRDYPRAEQTLQQAKRLASQPYMQYETSQQLGDLYVLRRTFPQAEAEYKLCEQLQNKYDYLLAGDIDYKLAETYRQMGKSAESATALQTARKIEAENKLDAYAAAYMTNMQAAVRKVWHTSAPTGGADKSRYTTVCSWLMDKQGRFSSVHISKSSGDEVLDKAALTALQLVQPDPAVPRSRLEYSCCEFTFTYNVH